MAYALQFEKLLEYDVSDSGVNVDITLTLNKKTVTLTAKIDTGASCCVFARNQAEELGIAVEQGMRQLFATATGDFLAYGHEVTLSVAGFEFDSFVFFAADEHIKRCVLGRFGWLDRIVLGLFDYEGKLYLNAYATELVHTR